MGYFSKNLCLSSTEQESHIHVKWHECLLNLFIELLNNLSHISIDVITCG